MSAPDTYAAMEAAAIAQVASQQVSAIGGGPWGGDWGQVYHGLSDGGGHTVGDALGSMMTW